MRERRKEQRGATKLGLDLKDPGRVTRRNARKKLLYYCVADWGLALIPFVLIVISVILSTYSKSILSCCIILAVSVLYAVYTWGTMLKAFLEIKKESKGPEQTHDN